MKWIDAKEIKPMGSGDIIVALIDHGRRSYGQPVNGGEIVMLRTTGSDELRTMDYDGIYYRPNDDDLGSWDRTIDYWIRWEDFGFPESWCKPEDTPKLGVEKTSVTKTYLNGSTFEAVEDVYFSEKG